MVARVADSSAYEAELTAARAIALDAADVVKSYAGRTFRIDSKPGDEPVTEADHAANELIVARLSAAFPQDAILSEELPDDVFKARRPMRNTASSTTAMP